MPTAASTAGAESSPVDSSAPFLSFVAEPALGSTRTDNDAGGAGVVFVSGDAGAADSPEHGGTTSVAGNSAAFVEVEADVPVARPVLELGSLEVSAAVVAPVAVDPAADPAPIVVVPATTGVRRPSDTSAVQQPGDASFTSAPRRPSDTTALRRPSDTTALRRPSDTTALRRPSFSSSASAPVPSPLVPQSPAPGPDGVVMSGLLLKKGPGALKASKIRFFRLEGDRIEYFPVEGGKCLGTIDLAQSTSVGVVGATRLLV